VDVDAMLEQIDARQFAEWRAYDILEPIGNVRLDWNSAQICQVLANVNRDAKETPEAYETGEFVLRWGDPKPVVEKPKQSDAQMLSIARLITELWQAENQQGK
jgi:hypothetical protein